MGSSISKLRGCLNTSRSRRMGQIAGDMECVRCRVGEEEQVEEIPLQEINRNKQFFLRLWTKNLHLVEDQPFVQNLLISYNALEIEPEFLQSAPQRIFHINIYNGEKCKVMDVTILKGMKEHSNVLEYFVFWENLSTSEIRHIYFVSNSENPPLTRSSRMHYVDKVQVWAESHCTTDRLKKHVVFSKDPVSVIQEGEIVDPVNWIFHVTEYNLYLQKLLNTIAYRGIKLESVSDEFLYCVDLRTDDFCMLDYPIKGLQAQKCPPDILTSIQVWVSFFQNLSVIYMFDLRGEHFDRKTFELLTTGAHKNRFFKSSA